MFADGGARAMILGLKFHLNAIFGGSKICNMNFPILGGGGGVKSVSNCHLCLIQFCSTSKIVSYHQSYD